MADNTRFYEQKFPEPDQVVMVQVKRVAEMGAYVSLQEYGNIEGMILLSELSKRRIRSISKLIRPGQHMAVSVIRVDSDKGYIDLSKRRVFPEEIPVLEEKFAKGKMVAGIIRHTAQQCEMDTLELCQKISWPLYAKYGHAYEAFKILMSSRKDEILSTLDLSDDVKAKLMENIQRRLQTQAVRLRAKVEVSCYEYAGIDAVKEALQAGLSASTEDVEIKIKLIAPPAYALVTTCIDKTIGMKKIEESMQLIEDKITELKGNFVIKTKAEVVGADDEDKEKAEGESDSESDSDETESEQDETMGQLNEADIEALRNARVDDD